ncbi:hypothetical protein [Rhizobium laguerreae]|uniref:hypothetical protein n=1 Tax=Rhizobium laguerreae TaxID=1076926 RepID=UPI00144195BB|nr:hypothetical protein [Rhizobium laguerreae]MBY3278235.1 hypothetical protein [Rhizobium laguerreae]NKM38559.1 hypothetical protein [Rhizobium laguerreae]NNH84492.1 hypothetical protein [Rhizobium laguerreae]
MNDGWIGLLDETALESALDEEMLSAYLEKGIEGVVPLVPSRITPGASYFEPPPFWDRISREFRILVCTQDEKFADVRAQLAAAVDAAKKPATQIIAALIAGAIGAEIGVFWGPIIGVVGVLLLVLLRLGKEAFCAGGGS